MKLTDDEITAALLNGKRVKRVSSRHLLNYFIEGGLFAKETADDRPRRICGASIMIDDLTADDWEVVQ